LRLINQRQPSSTHYPYTTLFRSKATALNRADLSQAAGNYPPPPGESEVLGLEAAGVVVAGDAAVMAEAGVQLGGAYTALLPGGGDRKSTRLYFSHVEKSYAVICV